MKEGVHKLSIIKCGTINPNSLKITGKPNRAMTPELKVSSIWTDRKNDYRRNKEKQKLRRYSEEYGNDGAFVLRYNIAMHKHDYKNYNLNRLC